MRKKAKHIVGWAQNTLYMLIKKKRCKFFSKHDFCLDVPTQQKIKKINKKCLPFHNRFYLVRINFYKVYM